MNAAIFDGGVQFHRQLLLAQAQGCFPHGSGHRFLPRSSLRALRRSSFSTNRVPDCAADRVPAAGGSTVIPSQLAGSADTRFRGLHGVRPHDGSACRSSHEAWTWLRSRSVNPRFGIASAPLTVRARAMVSHQRFPMEKMSNFAGSIVGSAPIHPARANAVVETRSVFPAWSID